MPQESDFLGHLEVREPVELAHYFLVHLRLHRRHCEKLRPLRPQKVAALRPCLELLEVWHDEQRRELSLVPDHYHLTHVLVCLYAILYRLRRDVLPARSDDDVLLPIGYRQKSIAQFTDVAGVKPSFGIDRLGSRDWIVVVPLHHPGSASQNLSVWR